MLNTKHPIKLAIAALFLDHQTMSVDEVIAALQPGYPGSKLIDPADIDFSIQSLSAVGILKYIDDGSPIPRYSLSAHGRNRVLANL